MPGEHQQCSLCTCAVFSAKTLLTCSDCGRKSVCAGCTEVCDDCDVLVCTLCAFDKAAQVGLDDAPNHWTYLCIRCKHEAATVALLCALAHVGPLGD